MSSSKPPRKTHENELPEPRWRWPDDIRELRDEILVYASVRLAVESGVAPAGLGLGPPPKFERFDALDYQVGGMGMVIEAHDPKLERKVAIKLWILPDSALDDAALDEAKTLARFTHPNVVQVYDVGDWNGRIYFVMEWIEGRDGYKWMLEPHTWRAIRDVYVEAARGLAAAHDAGIQHRDFKPSNMLIGDDGRVLVADFGVADSLFSDDGEDDELDELDDPSRVAGTPAYIAPERLRGGRGDARSDQFSFCVALWEALHGVRPYAGKTRKMVLASIEAGEVRASSFSKHVPGWLSRVVRKGLAEEPELRHADMRALIDALLGEPAAEEQPSLGSDGEVFGGRSGLLNTPARSASRADERSELDPASTVREPRRQQRWAFVGGIAVGLSIPLIVLLGWRSKESRSGDGGGEQPAPAASASPCALVGPADVEAPTDPVLVEVCRLIRDDHYTAADMLWAREHGSRLIRSDDSIGEDTLTIARTFVERAEALQHKDTEKARAAAQLARNWAIKAAPEYPLGQADPGIADIDMRVEKIEAAGKHYPN